MKKPIPYLAMLSVACGCLAGAMFTFYAMGLSVAPDGSEGAFAIFKWPSIGLAIFCLVVGKYSRADKWLQGTETDD